MPLGPPKRRKPSMGFGASSSQWFCKYKRVEKREKERQGKRINEKIQGNRKPQWQDWKRKDIHLKKWVCWAMEHRSTLLCLFCLWQYSHSTGSDLSLRVPPLTQICPSLYKGTVDFLLTTKPGHWKLLLWRTESSPAARDLCSNCHRYLARGNRLLVAVSWDKRCGSRFL